jgi:hypothetical protein
MSTYSQGTVTTSVAVASVNKTGEAMFGRPFIVTSQNGYEVQNQITVLTGNSSALVTVVGHTTVKPLL